MRSPPTVKPLETIGLFIAALLIAVEFVQARTRFASLLPEGAPHVVADGLAQFPFQYRILMPYLTKFVAQGTGADFYIVASLFDVAAVVILLLLTARWAHLLTRNFLAGVLAMILIAAMLRVHFLTAPVNNYYYQADIVAGLFFAAGILLIAAKRRFWLAALVALATLNRETAVMLVLIAVLAWSRSDGWRSALMRVAPALAAWAAVKLILWAAFLAHGSGVGQFWSVDPATGETRTRLALNILSLLQWQAWLVLAPVFGYAWIMVLFGRRIGDPTLTAALWSFPVFVGALLVAAIITEIRIFAEYLSVFAVAAVGYLDQRTQPRPQDERSDL